MLPRQKPHPNTSIGKTSVFVMDETSGLSSQKLLLVPQPPDYIEDSGDRRGDGGPLPLLQRVRVRRRNGTGGGRRHDPASIPARRDARMSLRWRGDRPVCRRGHPRRSGGCQRDTIVLNPPQNMRLPSNGIALGSIIFASRLSFIALALTRSRCLRDL